MKDRKTKQPLDSKKRTGYQIYKQALKLGLLLRPLGDIMYFNPPLTISKKEMKQVVKLCKQSFANVGIY